MPANELSRATASSRSAASGEALLSPKQAAELLNMSTSWLAKLRVKGGGPVYLKLHGAVRYRLSDLQSWLKAQLRVSTS